MGPEPRLLISSVVAANLMATPAFAQSDKFMAEWALWHGMTSAMTAASRCGRYDTNEFVIALRIERMQVSIKQKEWIASVFMPIVREDITATGLNKWCDLMWEYFGTKGTMLSHFLAIRPPAPVNQARTAR